MLYQYFQRFFQKNQFLLAVMIALIGSAGNALQGVYNKHFCDELSISTFQLLTIRCFVEIIIFFPFCIKYFKTMKQNFKIVAMLAFLYSCDILLYHTGLQSVSVNTGTLIMLLVPFWMCFFGKFVLREKGFTIINFLLLLVCVAGVLISVFGEIHFNGFKIGIVFILLNSVVLPVGVILQKKYSDVRQVVLALFTNAVVLAVIGYFLSYTTTGSYKLPLTFDVIKSSFIVAIFDVMECAGVYCSCKIAYVALLQPVRFTRFVFASLFSALILQQYINGFQIVSALIIIGANAISVFYSQKKVALKDKTLEN